MVIKVSSSTYPCLSSTSLSVSLSLCLSLSLSLSLSLPLSIIVSPHTGESSCDLWEFDITRFSPHTANKNYIHDRTSEILHRFISIQWPHWELESGRGVKKTPFHSRLEAEGASFGCVYGWERSNWFAREGGELSGYIPINFMSSSIIIIMFCRISSE